MVRKNRTKKLIPTLLFAVAAVVVMLVQSAVCPVIAISGVGPSLLPVAAAVAAVYLGGVRGAVFGALCGLFMDALVPDVSVWIYMAFLAIVCGAVGEASSYTYRGSILSSLFWSAAVLLAVGLMECVLFGVIRGGGFLYCARRAGIQLAYSFLFAIPMDLVFGPMARKFDLD